MKYTRKNRRSAGRKANRKNRKSSRRAQRGGWVVLNPAATNDMSMEAASKQNLAQGGEYAKIHAGQHGGGAPLDGAPVGYTGVLDSSLRTAAHLAPLDRSLADIQGMSDQSGGGRRRRRSTRKASRKGRKASKGRKGSRKSRKASKGRKGRRVNAMMRRVMALLRRRRGMRGGAVLNPADVGAPGTLLPAGLEKAAVGQMNPEWKLAEDPSSFAPKA